MNQIQKTAIKETAITVAGLTAIALLVPAVIFLIPLEAIITILMIGMLGYAIKMIYNIKLSQAEFQAKYPKE